jgi:hypothetical protein
MRRSINICRFVFYLFAASCSAPPAALAPTYSDLFANYFAPGTPGHCATSGCHADPGHNVWLCGSRETCYSGMLQMDLIDPAAPERSAIIDPSRSPLTWVNAAGGNMPLDAQGPNAAARAALSAWVEAGALDN